LFEGEGKMLMHLPFVIVAALPAIPAADNGVPQIDIVGECRFETDDQANRQRCVDNEKQALGQLEKEWAQFSADDQRVCREEATMGGAGSYAELLTCLEMARDSRAYEQSAQRSRK
jgi:hypothetical protein